LEARFSTPVQTGPGAHPASCTVGTVSFPGVRSGRGVTLTPHHLIVTLSRKSRAIHLLPLWAALYKDALYLFSYLACKTRGPYIVISGMSGSTTFFHITS